MQTSTQRCQANTARLTQLIRCQRGVAVVETVLIMGLMAGLVIMAMAALQTGDVMSNPFADMTAMQTDAPVDTAKSPNGGASAPTPTVVATEPRSTIGHGALMIGMCWTALLLGVVLAGHKRIRSTRDIVENDDPEDPPTNIEADHRFVKRQHILRILNQDMAMLLESRLTVRQLMSHNITVIPANMRCDEVLETMRNGKIRHLMVCRDGDQLQGVISDRDVHQKTGEKASDIMTANPVTVSPDSAINPAVTQLVKMHISCLPVVEDGRLVGVLTTTDLMLALQCSIQVLHHLALDATRDSEPVEPIEQIRPVDHQEPQLVESAS